MHPFLSGPVLPTSPSQPKHTIFELYSHRFSTVPLRIFRAPPTGIMGQICLDSDAFRSHQDFALSSVYLGDFPHREASLVELPALTVFKTPRDLLILKSGEAGYPWPHDLDAIWKQQTSEITRFWAIKIF